MAKQSSDGLSTVSSGLTQLTNGLHFVSQFGEMFDFSPKARKDINDVLKFLALLSAGVALVQMVRRFTN